MTLFNSEILSIGKVPNHPKSVMGLLDYPKYVKKPMDLNTISRKLKDGKYQTVENVLDDIQLIFDNCKVYNAPGSVNFSLTNKVDLQLSR